MPIAAAIKFEWVMESLRVAGIIKGHFKKSMYDRGVRGNPKTDRLIKCVYFTKRTWFACSV